MRTFIAIPLSDQIHLSLGQLQSQLKFRFGSSVSWTDPRSIHLTLKFLGEVSEGRIAEISKALDDACRNSCSFEFLSGGLGCYPNIRNPRVIWVGIQADARLKELQKNIENACENLGYAREERPFSPHLTLGRVKTSLTKEQLDFLNLSAEIENQKEKIPILVNQVNLYKSDLQRNGAKYSILETGLLKT